MNNSIEKIIKEFRGEFYLHHDVDCSVNNSINGDCDCDAPKTKKDIEQFISRAILDSQRETREEALNEFFQAVDAKYNDFVISRSMGKILRNLLTKKAEG